jgi:hypothetical protein
LPQPVILPPQSSNPLDPAALGKQPKESLTADDVRSLRFKKDWYLFLQAAQIAASTGNGIVQFGAGADRKALPTEGLPDGALWLETDTGLVYQWHGKTLDWVWVFGTMRAGYKLTAATFAIPAPTQLATPGVKLILALMQDGTGGRAITFGAGFAFASVSLGAALANTASFLEFTLFSVADLAVLGITSAINLWVMTSQPLTDMAQ